MIECQRANIFKIRDNILGHGLQPILFRYYPLFNGSEYVKLGCGCSMPISWIPNHEKVQLQPFTKELKNSRKRIRLCK